MVPSKDCSPTLINYNNNVSPSASVSVPSTTFALLQSKSEISDLMCCIAESSTTNQIEKTYTLTELTETPLELDEDVNSFPSLKLKYEEHSHFYSNIVTEAESIMEEQKQNEQQTMTKLFTNVTSHEDQTLYKHNYEYDKKICNALQGEIFRAKIIQNNDSKSDADSVNSINNSTLCDNAEQYVGIKKIDKHFVTSRTTIRAGTTFCIDNNVCKEALILKYLTLDNNSMTRYIVKYTDFFESADYYFLVFEYIPEAITLKKWIQIAHKYIQQKKLSLIDYLKVVRYIIWQIFAVIHWLHTDMNCCHLNLNLKNILLQNSNFIHYDDGTVSVNPKICVKISHFEVAELFQCPEKKDRSDNFQCMKQLAVFLDIQYQCPKMSNNEIYDARKADIFAVGMILYEMCVGKPLYNKLPLGKPVSGTGYWAAITGNVMEYIYTNKLQKYINGKLSSLLYGLINPDEKMRLNSKQILKHQWFKSYYDKYKHKIKRTRTAEQKKKKKCRRQQVALLEYSWNK